MSSAATSEGYWTQIVQSGGAGSDAKGFGVATTSTGATIVTGSFSGTAYFPTGPAADDSIAVTSSGAQESFVAKQNADDSFYTWVQTTSSGSDSRGLSVAVTADDTPIVTGYFAGTAYFPTGPATDDSIALTAAGSRDIFVAALNADDSYYAWAQSAGGTSSEEGFSVTTRADGATVISGFFYDTAYFPTGPAADDSIALTSAGLSDVYVAQLNADDSYFAWAQSAGGLSSESAEEVAITADDSPMITGYFAGTAYFPTAADDSIAVTSQTGFDTFVAQMNADDSYFAWVQTSSGTGNVSGYGLSTNAVGDAAIAGDFTGTAYFPTGPDDSVALTATGPRDGYVAKLNTDDSYFAWAQSFGGTDINYALSISVTSFGSSVVTGFFKGTTYFPTADDSIAISSAGNNDIFVAQMNRNDGNFAWAQRAGGTANDIAHAVTVNADDSPIVTGYLSGTASFPTSSSTSITRTALGNPDALVGYLTGSVDPGPSPSPTPTPTPTTVTPTPTPTAVPASAPVDVMGEPGEGSATISWAPSVSSGSYPITNYQAEVMPGAASCVVAAPETSCVITDLSPGVAYTATVRALTGAGWSRYSVASAQFSPLPPAEPSILITGERSAVRGKSGIRIEGATAELAAGTILRPWTRLPGQTSYSEGVARIRVDDAGGFTWQRRTGKRIAVIIKTQDGAVRSNRVIIRAL